MSEIAILNVFEGIPDHRRKQGTRHSLPLCLALFTLAVVAGNHGFLSIGDWLKSHSQQLQELFDVKRLPSYSTIRRALLNLDYEEYSCRLAQFFEITTIRGETLALDGKVLRGSYLLSEFIPHSEPHKAITLVTAYLVERRLILKPQEVENKSNEMQRIRADRRLATTGDSKESRAVPKLIESLALDGTVIAFDAMNTQKNS